MKNSDIYSLYQILSNISSIKLPAKATFAIIRNLKIIEPIVKDIEDARIILFKKYGEEAEGVFHFPEDKVNIVDKELTSLAETNIDILLVKVKESDLENLNLSIEEAKILLPMIEEEG